MKGLMRFGTLSLVFVGRLNTFWAVSKCTLENWTARSQFGMATNPSPHVRCERITLSIGMGEEGGGVKGQVVRVLLGTTKKDCTGIAARAIFHFTILISWRGGGGSQFSTRLKTRMLYSCCLSTPVY